MSLNLEQYKFGLVKAPADSRDLKLRYAWNPFKKLPESVDLSAEMPPIEDQGKLGSCTSFASLATWHHVKAKQIREQRDDDTNIFRPSYLFQYYNSRKLMGTVDEDSGATVRDAYKALQKFGVCPDTDWPYETKRLMEQPPEKAYRAAQDSQLIKYINVYQSLFTLKSCLADGYPAIFGIILSESFMDKNGVAKTGVMTRPRRGEQVLGGHCVAKIGYDDRKQAFLVRNSWSEAFGVKGCFWLPYDIAVDRRLCMDFYSARAVE